MRAALAALVGAQGELTDEATAALLVSLADQTAAAEQGPLSEQDAAALLATVELPRAGGDDDAPRPAAIVDQITYDELDRRTESR